MTKKHYIKHPHCHRGRVIKGNIISQFVIFNNITGKEITRGLNIQQAVSLAKHLSCKIKFQSFIEVAA